MYTQPTAKIEFASTREDRISVKVQVLISTLGDSIRNAPLVVESIPENIDVLIVHQKEPSDLVNYKELFPHREITVIESFDKGLAKSRNLAVSHATGDILIPTDDDVRFLTDSFTRIIDTFSECVDAQLISFQIVSKNGQTYMPYKKQSYRHNLQTIRRVSSIELAFRRDAFTQLSLRWDEDFGLNSRYAGGLEQAFMKNVLDSGLPAYYCPIPIVEHPADSTGFHHTPESGFYRGAVYAKLYGRYSRVILVAFALKNAWRTGSIAGSFRYVRYLFSGANDYIRRIDGRQ
jgi:glycosyltransferase involved in cell wall biosynthesis